MKNRNLTFQFTIIITLLISLITACSTHTTSKTNADAITQTDVERAVKLYANVTYDDLVKGQSLYKENCGNCHGLKKPTYTNEEGWRKVVPRMSVKVNRKAGTMVLGEKEQELIVRYLVTLGSK
jgi:mono/diheme cytochrome c family protein